MSRTVAVIGGGVAGVVVAHELSRRGISVDLLEKAPQLGGLQRSLTRDGLHFDIGAFVFGRDHELLLTFPFLVPLFVPFHPKDRVITPCDRVDAYPLTLRGYIRGNGAWASLHSLADLVYARFRYAKRDSVPSYARYFMGDTIYRRSGLKSYIERLNGMPDSEVGWEFVHQRLCAIEGFTLGKRLGRFCRMALGPSGRRAREPSLARPAQGFQHAYSLIAEALEKQGVRIRTHAQVRSVRRAGGSFVVEGPSIGEEYRRVVSTVPIPVMLALLGEASTGAFRQRSLVSLFYRGRVRSDATVLYNFSHRGQWKRIVVFSRVYGRAAGDDYFTVEVLADSPGEERTRELREDFETHACSLRLMEPGFAALGHVVTPRAYPVFRRGDTASLEADRDKLASLGVDFVGRQGAFEYLSSASASAKARDLAGRIAASL